jgi:hypothetical protein
MSNGTFSVIPERVVPYNNHNRDYRRARFKVPCHVIPQSAVLLGHQKVADKKMRNSNLYFFRNASVRNASVPLLLKQHRNSSVGQNEEDFAARNDMNAMRLRKEVSRSVPNGFGRELEIGGVGVDGCRDISHFKFILGRTGFQNLAFY